MMWTCKKGATIIGSFLMMLPIGLPWYWGNMAIYARSYIAAHGNTIEGLQTPWIISFYFLFNAVGFFIAGVLSKYVGKRLTLFLGIVLFLGGLFTTALTLNISLLMVNLTLGFVAGVGGGVINGLALQYAVGWAGSDLGFVTSFVQGGFNTGPVFINPFITLLVNPNNLTPDLELGPNNLFSQNEVIDRVPRLFYSFGILCSALLILGFLVIRDAPEKKTGEEEALHPKKTSTCTSPPSDVPKSYGLHIISDFPKPQFDTKKIELPTLQTDVQQLSTDLPTSNGTLNNNAFKDLKPSEIIRTKSFYTLAFSLMMFDNSMLILANYYKEYGAEWISNDHFLTMLATALTFSTIIAFPAWGALTDRLGVKRVLIVMFSTSSILIFSMYFTPRVSRWAYLVNVSLSGSFLPPIFSVLIIANCKLFGKTYYSSNLGLVASLSFLANFINPIIFETVLSLGWFYTFLYGGCLLTAGLLFITTVLPNI